MSFSKLVDVLINLRKFTVIKIKCSGIVSAVAKYFCHKGKILCHAGNREYGIAHLLIEKEVVFSVLLDIIECFICFGRTLVKGISLGTHAKSGRNGCNTDLKIFFLLRIKAGKQSFHKLGYFIFTGIRYKKKEFIATKPAANRISDMLGEESSKCFQCTVSGFMTVDIIYLFQIIHIHKDQTAIVLLHQLCNHFLTGISHRESGKKIKIFYFLLALHRIHNIGNEVADFKFHARKSWLVINFQISICDRQTILIHQSEKNICDFRIELSSSVFAYFFINCFFWKRITVNTAGIHCVIAVSNSNDSRMDRNFFTF